MGVYFILIRYLIKDQILKKLFIVVIISFTCFLPFEGQKIFFSATDFTRKPVINFTQREYGDTCHTQNWSVVEDSRGIMHFGNNTRVLHYNGVSWDATRIPLHGGFVTSLAADKQGNVYVGANGEFGKLKPCAGGSLCYVSLSDSLDVEESFFGTVWRVMLYQGGVLFFSQEKMFHWKEGKIQVIDPETSFHLAFVVNDKLFVRQREKGLMKFTGNQLKLIPDGEIFRDYGVFGIFPAYENEKYLIVTQEKGLYIYCFDEKHPGIRSLHTPYSSILTESRIIGGTMLHNGNIALSTLNNGVIIINNEGHVKDIIDQNTGMRDNDVKQVYQDSWNNLWMALNTGICRVNYSSPISVFDANAGIYGSVQAMVTHENTLFAGTSNGLFVENTNITDKLYDHFLKTEGFNKPVKNLNTVNDAVIIGTREGLYEYVEYGRIRQIKNIDASSVYRSSERNLLFVAGSDGFFIFSTPELDLVKSSGDFIIRNPLTIAEMISTGSEETELWVGTLNTGVFNIFISAALDIRYEHYFGAQAGLGDTWVKPFQYKDDVLFGVNLGLMEFVDERGIAEQEEAKKNQLRGFFNYSPVQPVERAASLNHFLYSYGKTWFCFDNRLAYSDDQGNIVKKPFSGLDLGLVNQILPLDSNTLFVAADDGLASVNVAWVKDYSAKPNINFYRINTKNDSLLYSGYSHINDVFTSELSYEYNDITFYYASQFEENNFRAEYSYKLKGFSDEWSEWSYDNRTAFTNLREGDYLFKVKARDLYGNESPVATFGFIIDPPWYRTLGAYALYVCLAVLIVYGIVRLSIMRLKAKNIQLEKIIAKRTEEIRSQKEEIEKQHTVVLKQKEQITSSITYASRIQNALVPDEGFLRDNLPEHFILWMPRDIVSGDFYWAKKIEPYIFIVAADCTGHGVPGAFMSMLGIAFLNEIVQHEKISRSKHEKDEMQASFALEEMRRYVKTTLRQTGERDEQKDGMDLALCAINTSNNTLYYSGANSPLILIRNNELTEYKPTRNPIGIHVREESFANHKIDLRKGDTVYMFSDGYRDQFGGANGDKFGKKAFKELLLEIHYRSVNEQKQMLEATIRDWMADRYSQLDDVLVVGFRI